MRAYLIDDEGGNEELGDVDCDAVLGLIDRAQASLDGDRPVGIGFARSERDVLEVRPVDEGDCLLLSDRIGKPDNGWIGRLFGKPSIDRVVPGRGVAVQAAFDHMDLSREAFERTYI